MKFFRTLLVAGSLAFAATASAETRLTDFNGEWSGAGQDRDSPLASLQDTTCQNAIRANPKRLHTEMTCERKPGIRKLVRLTVTLEGDQFTGKITRKVSQPGRADEVINGTVSGKKTDNAANLLVRWQGPTPNTTVDLKLNAPGSYSMKVTALGIGMMDVTFKQTSSERPLPRNAR